jgi:hypothetical protein
LELHPWALGTIGSKLASFTADVSDLRITVGPYCEKVNVEEGAPVNLIFLIEIRKLILLHRSFYVPHSVAAALLLE